MNIIDLEAHFSTDSYTQYLSSRKEPPKEELVGGQVRVWQSSDLWSPRSIIFDQRLKDFEKERLAAMDAAGVDIQVLSLVLPGCEQFGASEGTAIATKTNDELAEVVRRHPDRFLGLASLAPQDPERASQELERTIKELGFKGANINSIVGGEYLDNRKFWPVFEKAEQLDVPIYIHPTVPSSSMLKPYTKYGMALAGPPLGFGAEGILHAMRLIYSGVFDVYPGLKIILGHLGEGLPFWLERIDFFWLKPWTTGDETRPHIKKKPSEYIKSNFILTTSGMSFLPALIGTYLALGAEMITFGTDYPFENSKQSSDAINAMPICSQDKEKILRVNAERLFKLK